MKIRSIHSLFFCFLVMISSVMAHPRHIDLDYRLDWCGDHIHVTLKFTPRTACDSVLHYGDMDFGGQTDIFGCIKNLQAQGTALSTDSVKRTVTLRDMQRKTIRLEYDIISRLSNNELTCPMEMFRPNITRDFIYCHGVNLFLRLPDTDSLPRIQRIMWGQHPDFPVFCLYNAGNSLAPITGPAKDFHSTLIVGDRGLHVDTLTISGTPNYVVTAPRTNVIFNRTALADYFRKFYTGITQFWEEKQLSPYALIVYPFEKIPFEVSGTGLNHGFCARYNPHADTILTSNRIDLFSHEIGHNWISADMNNQWFGEGFNEMQTMYMVAATGLKPIDSFVSYLNNSIEKLYHSEIRNLPNDSIRVHFWELGDYSWIAYWRGAVYAFRLLGQLEHATGDQHPFKTLMMALKGHTTSMNREKFLSVVSRFMDRSQLEEEFDRYIMRAETIELDPECLLSGCTLRHKADGTPYIEITDRNIFEQHFIL